MPDIEIALDVEILAGIAFWIDRAEWEAKSDEDKRTYIGTVIDSIATELSNDVVQFQAGNLSAEITGPSVPDLSKVQVYDPKEN